MSGMGYAITATAPGFGAAEYVLGDTQITISTTRPGEQGKVTLKDLVLTPANRTVRGSVKDSRGQGVPGVILTTRSGEGLGLSWSAVSDEKGQFVLEKVSGDRIIVLAKAPGRGWIGTSTLNPGETEITIDVAPSHYD